MLNSFTDCFYRISVKALILDDNQRFLLVKEESGMWELPGGGLEFSETPREALTREIREEMGLTVTAIEQQPSYFLTAVTTINDQVIHFANVIYRTSVQNLDFIPSDECMEIRFFTVEDVFKEQNIYCNVTEFAKLFKERKITT